jgi:hypothetical protein
MNKNLPVIIGIFASLLLYSCSHKFAKLQPYDDSRTIEQVLKLKIYTDNETERLTVYTQVDRKNQRAILNGVGRLDKHVFSLEVNKDRYVLKDHINKKEEKGYLSEFSIIPLETDLIFNRVDINNKQPIIFENDRTKIEIKVIEQNTAYLK